MVDSVKNAMANVSFVIHMCDHAHLSRSVMNAISERSKEDVLSVEDPAFLMLISAKNVCKWRKIETVVPRLSI